MYKRVAYTNWLIAVKFKWLTDWPLQERQIDSQQQEQQQMSSNRLVEDLHWTRTRFRPSYHQRLNVEMPRQRRRWQEWYRLVLVKMSGPFLGRLQKIRSQAAAHLTMHGDDVRRVQSRRHLQLRLPTFTGNCLQHTHMECPEIKIDLAFSFF